MHSRNHKPTFGGWLGRIFLCSLTFCLCLSHVFLTSWQAEFGELITAQIMTPQGRLAQVSYWEEPGDYQGVGVYGQSSRGESQENLFPHTSQRDYQRAIRDLQGSLKIAQKTGSCVLSVLNL